MLYQNENKTLFHIHIPRTGGRYIRELFSANSFDYYHGKYEFLLYGIETPHLHYPLYLDLELVEESEHFAVVRNPFDRFKSCIQTTIKARGYPEEIYEKLKDKDWLFYFLDLEKIQSSYMTNFYRNQKDFISEKTKIWKIEDGLNIKFVRWINDNFDLSLKYFNDIEYPLLDSETIQTTQEIDPSIEELIKEYYAEDYEYFNYQ